MAHKKSQSQRAVNDDKLYWIENFSSFCGKGFFLIYFLPICDICVGSTTHNRKPLMLSSFNEQHITEESEQKLCFWCWVKFDVRVSLQNSRFNSILLRKCILRLFALSFTLFQYTLRLTFIAINFPFDLISENERKQGTALEITCIKLK